MARHSSAHHLTGSDLDPELCTLYKLLNQDCQQINTEKKQRIVRKVTSKGLTIREKDVNLLDQKALHRLIGDDSGLSSNSNSAKAESEGSLTSGEDQEEEGFRIDLRQSPAKGILYSGTGKHG
jgi:hypothetical protein